MDYYLYTGIYLDNAEDFGSKHTSLQMLDLYYLSLVLKNSCTTQALLNDKFNHQFSFPEHAWLSLLALKNRCGPTFSV